MTDKKMSEFSTATPALGTDLVPVIRSGVNRKVTAQDLANLAAFATGGVVTGDVTFQGTVVFEGATNFAETATFDMLNFTGGFQLVDPINSQPVFQVLGPYDAPTLILIGAGGTGVGLHYGTGFDIFHFSPAYVVGEYTTFFWGYAARGTVDTPVDVIAGQLVSTFGGSAWNSNDYRDCAEISVVVEAVNGTYVRGMLSFKLWDGTSSVGVERGWMSGDGGLVWGVPTGGSKGAGSINVEKVYVNGVRLNGSQAVAALPAASSVPLARTFVTDATATTFHSIVAGSGANLVPVWSDGTNWRIGG